ncbi:hypothetical protein [Sporisorium scitamineum]|nr:hypothetical protein [Sporisorium scitamineum]
MADMERLGYNPATIMEEISALEEQSGPDFYKRDSYDWMTSLLINGGRYMKKFDDDKELDDLYFNIFSLMFSPIDDTVGPWFQAPIFNNFDIARGKIATIKYTFLGLPFPILDRIRYKSKMDVWGHFHLIPLSIVRPVQVIPEVKFRTLYEFSPQLSSLGTVEFSRIRAFTVRLKEDPVPKMSGSRKSYWFFGTLRPFGNPLYYIETRLKKVLERNPEMRGIIVPEVGRGKSSSKKGEGSSRLAIPRLENPTFDYQYISQSQHAEGSTSRLAKPKKKSPAFADQPLSRYQHAEVMPATPNWLPGDRHPSSQHFRDEVAQIHAWGHSEAPSEQTSESSHTIDKHVIEPVVGHYYPRTPAYALPSYGGYERAVEPVGVDQPPAQHSNQPIDSRLYTPSHQHSKPPVLAGQHGSAQHESTPSHVASFDPVESLEHLEMHLDPVRYGWH